MAAGLVVPAVLLLLALPALAQDAGRIGIRLLEAPVERASEARAQIYIVDHVAPGDSFSRDVEITSTTSEPVSVDLYAAASSVVDGSWRPLDGRAQNELTGWMTVTPGTVTPTDGEPVRATVSFDVPADASEGEHYAVIWAQPPGTSEGDIRVVNRVGIRVYLSVGPGGEPPTDFEIVGLTPTRTAEGAPQLDARIRNRGGRAIDIGGEVALVDGPGGAALAPTAVPRGTTVPVGEEAVVHVPFPADLPEGPWTAHVTMRANHLEEEMTSRIQFSGDAPAEVRGSLPVEVPPDPVWPVVVAALLLVLLIIAIFLLLRRRDADAGDDGPLDVEPGRVRTPAGV